MSQLKLPTASMNTLSACALHTPSLTLQTSPDGVLALIDNQTGQRVIQTPAPGLFAPELDGARGELCFTRAAQAGPERLELHFQRAGLESFSVLIEARPGEDAFEFSCRFRTRAATQLNAIEFFPRGTALDCYDVINYRNRHHTPATWPELLAESGPGFKTDTYSTDWQFAPHPTLLLFRKIRFLFCLTAFELPRAYGMYLEVAEKKVQRWHLDYGDQPHGQPLAAGEEFVSPRFRFFSRHDTTVERMLDVFARMLIEGGQIQNPTHKAREAWWREPVYCTWIDQVYLSRTVVPVELKDQANVDAAAPKSVTILTEQFVRDAVKVIQREKLPFRTILIDAGWAVGTGQYEPHPERFPNMRGLVDELHAQGFKVVVWWSWAEIWKDVEVTPTELAGGGKLNRHGARTRDYSLPATQEYLRKLFHFLFSSDPGCCDLDGVKTDFLADKVHPESPPADPAWRGEENYFVQLSRLFYTELKRHKPDGIHVGCAGHFWLAEYIDINRTFDVAGTNYLQHEERARMLRHTTPGCPVAYDLPNFVENLERTLLSAHECGASYQVGNVLRTARNQFTAPEVPSADYYAALRRLLPFQRC
jgi:hypothetical protein